MKHLRIKKVEIIQNLRAEISQLEEKLRTQIEYIKALKLQHKEMEKDLVDLSVTIKIIQAAVDPYDRFEKK